MTDDEEVREECWDRYESEYAYGVPIVSMKDELHKTFIAGWYAKADLDFLDTKARAEVWIGKTKAENEAKNRELDILSGDPQGISVWGKKP